MSAKLDELRSKIEAGGFRMVAKIRVDQQTQVIEECELEGFDGPSELVAEYLRLAELIKAHLKVETLSEAEAAIRELTRGQPLAPGMYPPMPYPWPYPQMPQPQEVTQPTQSKPPSRQKAYKKSEAEAAFDDVL